MSTGREVMIPAARAPGVLVLDQLRPGSNMPEAPSLLTSAVILTALSTAQVMTVEGCTRCLGPNRAIWKLERRMEFKLAHHPHRASRMGLSSLRSFLHPGGGDSVWAACRVTSFSGWTWPQSTVATVMDETAPS